MIACLLAFGCGGRSSTVEGGPFQTIAAEAGAVGTSNREGDSTVSGSIAVGGAGGGAGVVATTAVGRAQAGTAPFGTEPVRVQGISVGNEAACAWQTDGSVWCWGEAFLSMLAESPAEPPSQLPRHVPSLSGARAVAVAKSNELSRGICSVATNGAVRCMGEFVCDASDQSKRGSIDASSTAGNVTQAVAVGVAADHACALLADGSVQCWGCNNFGQLGTGQIDAAGTAPHGKAEIVPGVNAVASLSVGPDRTCVALSNGTIKCWGWNYSQEYLAKPEDVGLIDAGQVSIGDNFTCAVFRDSSSSCWGVLVFGTGYPGFYSPDSPSQGQLGRIGTAAIASGYYHWCELRLDHSIDCWGRNYGGMLGTGSSVDYEEEQWGTVVEIEDAKAIDAGYNQTCAIRSDSSVWCWGAKTSVGWTTDSAVPLRVPGLPK